MPETADTILYTQFLAARELAITLTDRYRACNPTDPGRHKLWTDVMHQTETARLLLERWLRQVSGTVHSRLDSERTLDGV